MKKQFTFIIAMLSFILSGSVQAQNLLSHWDANDLGLNQKSIANTEMFRWGWYSNASGYNWGTANIGAGNIRYCDAPTIHKNATKNGTAYVGRFAQVRWDGASGNTAAYTTLGYGDGTATSAGAPDAVQLTGGKAYKFSFWKYAEGSIAVKMHITTDPSAADESKTIATFDIKDDAATKDIKYLDFDFECPQTDGYYLVFKYVSGSVKILYMTGINLQQITIPVATEASNTTESGFTANWSAVAGASAYQLDIAAENEFTNFVEGYNSKPVSSTSEAVTGLTQGTTYYYRVRAINEAVPSENSNIVSVTTTASQAPEAPVAANAEEITPIGFTAKWSPANGAISYRLDVATDEYFSQIVPQYNDFVVAGTSHKVSGLNPNTSYFYRVRTYNGSISENSNTISSKTQRLLIVLLAGQSNMAGRGIYSELAPADTVTYSNILSLNKDSVWVRAKHPLHWDKAEAAVGMGITFARSLADKIGGDVAIGLVPCAAGGTSINGWLNDEWFAYTSNIYLYTNLITRAKKAAQSGDIIGMIWHQGESDASSTEHNLYQGKMQTLFTNIRKDLNIPNMPIVAGELGPYLAGRYTYFNEINAAIKGLADVLPAYAVTKSTGLTANSDNLHFTAKSQVEFGKRYAEIFYSLYDDSAALLTSLVCGSGTLSPVFNSAITEYTCYLTQDITSVTPVVTYIGAEVTGLETVDVSSGTGVSTITVTSSDGSTKIYTVNYVRVADQDYTYLIINNDFDLAPDPADCSKSIAVAEGIDGWVNSAWRPKQAICKQIYGWTSDFDFDNLGNNSQGINANTGGTKHGDWAAWIAGNYQLAKEVYEFYQVIDKDDLPAGTYKIECMFGVQHAKLTTQRVFANNNVQYHGRADQYVSNLTTGEHNTFAGYPSGENNMKDVAVYTTIGESDSLKIGIRTGNKMSNGTAASQANPMWGWFKMDYFRLTKIDPVKAGNAKLADITLSTGELNFSPENTSYNVQLPEGTQNVTATVTPYFQDIIVTGDGLVDVSSGSGVSNITVTALDRITQKTYTINYKIGNGTGIQEINAKADYYLNGRKLTVKGVESYTVYGINGIKIADVKANTSEAGIDLMPGAYIVKAQNTDTFKVIVQ